jgi:hypothetical protein
VDPLTRGPLQRPTTFDIDQEQMRHDDALHWLGELTCFLSWWRPDDFDAGRVTRCPTCYLPFGDVADAYRQSSINKCKDCYGTTFHGGIKYIWFRPAIWDLTPVSDQIEKRGDVTQIRGTIDTPSDIDLHEGDAAVRNDGTRWLMDQPQWQEITTGFGSQRGIVSRRMRGKSTVIMDDPTSVTYLPYVDLTALSDTGWHPKPNQPHPLDQYAPPANPGP